MTARRADGGWHRRRLAAVLVPLAVLALCAAAAWLTGTGLDERSRGEDGLVLLPASGGAAAPVQARASEAPPGKAVAGRRLGESLVLAPRVAGIADGGFVITAQSDAATLARHGLRVGDTLMSLDGRPLDSVRISKLGEELAVFDAVDVSYERAGQVRHRLLTFD